jgi:sigma-E factor negative regulatory protein RseA
MREKLSALIDAELDELDERRVLNALRDDAELRRTWERYHVIRSAVTRQLGAVLAPGFAERVSARLEAEGQEATRQVRLWPLAGGFAAAALVAAAAFLGVQMLRTPAGPPASLAVAPPAEPAASVNVTAAGPELASVAAAETPTPIDASGSRLNAYLFGHNEFMPTAGMGSMLPYVRVVTHRPDADAPPPR